MALSVDSLIGLIKEKARTDDAKKVDGAFAALTAILTGAGGSDLGQLLLPAGLTIRDALTQIAAAIKDARKAGAESRATDDAVIALQKLLG